MGRKPIMFTVGIIGALVIAYFIIDHLKYVSTDNAQIEAHAVMLAPKVSGFITKVEVDEGQAVKKGDVLVEIDPRDYENSIRQFKAELTSVEARKADAEHSFRRIADLYKSGAVSQQQFDTANATHLEVNAKYESLSAQLAQANLNLENTQIRAPIDGIIAKKSAEVGQFAAPGVPVVGFVGNEERWVTANFKETELEDIKVGNPVSVTVDALSRATYKGKVEAIQPATGATFTLLPPDNATGNFTKVVQRVPVKIHLTDLSAADIQNLRAGLSAIVKVRK